jgi:ribosomal protein L21E
MALRASRSSSTNSLLSKFKAAASQAQAYQISDTAYKYNQGQITVDEYLEFLDKTRSGMTPGTSKYLSMTKTINSVRVDKDMNQLETEISLGTKDPVVMQENIKEITKRLDEYIVNNQVLEDTPEYNSILKKKIAYQDAGVDYNKKMVMQNYDNYKHENPADADNQLLEYLKTLPEQYKSPKRQQEAQFEYEDFKYTKFQNDTRRKIQATELSLSAMGADTLEKKRIMTDTYASLYQEAADAGLNDVANRMLSGYYNSSNAFENALNASIKSGNENASRIISEKVSEAKSVLSKADPSDAQGYFDKYASYVEGLLTQRAAMEAAGNLGQIDSIDRELERMGIDPKTGKSSIIDETSGQIMNQQLADSLAKDNSMVRNIVGLMNPYDPKNPQPGQFIVAYENGEFVMKKITGIDATPDGKRDIKFAGSEGYIYDPDGKFYQITNNSTDNGKPIVTYNKPKNDGSGTVEQMRVGYNGDDARALGVNIGGDVYRIRKADGGYEYQTYDGQNTVENITAEEASKKLNKTLGEVLAGSENENDKKLLNSYIANQVYNDKMTAEIEAIRQLAADQVAQVKSNAEATVTKAVSGIKSIANETQQENIRRAEEIQKKAEMQTPEIRVPNVPKATSNLRAVLRGNAGLPATPMKTPSAGWAGGTGVIGGGNYVDPVAMMSGKREEVGSVNGVSYFRVAKPGGYDYIKGDGFKLSVEDVAKETGQDVNKLKDQNAQYKWVN